MKIKQYAGLMALSLFASNIKMPFYSGSSNFRNSGRFDANEINKARKRRTRKKQGK